MCVWTSVVCACVESYMTMCEANEGHQITCSITSSTSFETVSLNLELGILDKLPGQWSSVTFLSPPHTKLGFKKHACVHACTTCLFHVGSKYLQEPLPTELSPSISLYPSLLPPMSFGDRVRLTMQSCTVWNSLASNSQKSFLLCLMSSGIKCMHHNTWLLASLLIEPSSQGLLFFIC